MAALVGSLLRPAVGMFSKCFTKLTPRIVPRERKLQFCASHGLYLQRGYLSVSPEVADAIQNGRPVVALESTIIAHGMPYPQNLQTALMVEDVVRQNGAIPATVALLNGKLCVGMTKSELEYLATSKSNVIKSSRRDLSYVISQKLDGSTTVSGTMVAAHLAGIRVFVTGGIGGVHRGAESTMDISADLTELGRTPVAVVCAGVKSILDIGRTLEYLETQGVPVVTLGEGREFPAFFTRKSGFISPYKLQTAEEIARDEFQTSRATSKLRKTLLMIAASHLSVGLSSGLLVAVPIPEEFAMDAQDMETAIANAINQAKTCGVTGKDLTPFILSAVNKLTSGRSLEANVGLIRNNAAVGSQIACRLANLPGYPSFPVKGFPPSENKLGKMENRSTSGTSNNVVGTANKSNQNNSHPAVECGQETSVSIRLSGKTAKRIVVVGGVNFDLTLTHAGHHSAIQTNGMTYRGHLRHSFGGVGRNIADCLSRLGCTPLFISVVGNDWVGKLFRQQFTHMDLTAVGTSERVSTAAYSAILSASGDLLYGIGDFGIHDAVSPQHIQKYEQELKNAKLVCMDGNISHESMDFVTDICHHSKVPVWFEPTDINQVGKLFKTNAWKKLTYISPNINELQVFTQFLEMQHQQLPRKDPTELKKFEILTEALEFCQPLCAVIADYVPNIILTMGRYGALIVKRNDDKTATPKSWNNQDVHLNSYQSGRISLQYYPAVWQGFPEPTIQSVSGAGDCLAATIMAGIQAGLAADVCARLGILAARKSLESVEAVPASITPELLETGAAPDVQESGKCL